jgi:hypothetical protein
VPWLQTRGRRGGKLALGCALVSPDKRSGQGAGDPGAKGYPVSEVTYMASASRPERAVFRLRKWIIHRLVSLVDHLHLEKDEAVVEQIARCVRDTVGGMTTKLGPLPGPCLVPVEPEAFRLRCWHAIGYLLGMLPMEERDEGKQRFRLNLWVL